MLAVPESAPAFTVALTEGTTPKLAEQGTEFWPPIFGLRLKVSDTLLALFTGLLFFATWRLYKATNNLVLDAREASFRQLRAYVSQQGFNAHEVALAMPRMIRELSADPSSGFLGAHAWFGITTVMLQYWLWLIVHWGALRTISLTPHTASKAVPPQL